MTNERYLELCAKEGAIQLAHPEFDKEYHKNTFSDVTILICQRKTKLITQLCLESILRFYPDIPIFIVDGLSQDDSTQYLKYKKLIHPNIHLWIRDGINSHGFTMDEAIMYIKTKYVLTMDSDTIVNRGGWIEQLIKQFEEDGNLYATGSLMLVSESGEGCNFPQSENDVLKYIHPSCGLFDVEKYRTLKGFHDHGAPNIWNMIDAKEKGYNIGAFPIDKYVSHLSGHSWVKEHLILWKDDYNVFIRPFITFLVDTTNQFNQIQHIKDKDCNVVILGDNRSITIWQGETRAIDNKYYDIRYSVNGEYAVRLYDNDFVNPDFVSDFKEYIIECLAPEKGRAMGCDFWSRNYFQREIALR